MGIGPLGCRTTEWCCIKIPLPAVGLVGVGPLGCRTTEWGRWGVGLLLHRTTGRRTTGCRTKKRRTTEDPPCKRPHLVGVRQ